MRLHVAQCSLGSEGGVCTSEGLKIPNTLLKNQIESQTTFSTMVIRFNLKVWARMGYMLDSNKTKHKIKLKGTCKAS